MTLSLTMICKSELENLQRLYPLVKDHIDEWVVVVPLKDPAIPFLKDKAKIIEQDFTQGIEPKYIQQMKQYGLEVDKDYRLFNFAAARNASLEAATGDFILWLDADDTPIGMENIKPFLAQNSDVDMFNAIYDYSRDEEGNPISDHIRERVVKNDGKWVWLGAELGLIHETLLPKPPYTPTQLDFPEDLFRVEHHSDHVQESSMRNHIALLYEYLKTKGKDARTTYYLGIEFFNRRMWEYCIKILLEYVKVGGSQEDRFNAWLKIGEAYHMLDDPKSGRNAYLEAEKEMPHRPDAYLNLGESYFEEQEYAKAVEFMMTGLQKKLPKSKQAVDKIKYTFRPAGYIAQAFLQLGKPKQAYEWFLRAASANPKHPWLKKHAALFKDAKDLHDYVTSFVKVGQISQRLYPKTLSKLAEAVPEELKDQEILMDFKWRYTKPVIWPNNSVIFFCSHAFEDWGPESLYKEGCGGSEEAVIQLSKRLVKLGWDVTVYNNCIKEQTADGVKWVRFERFNPRDIFNVLVSWRNNIFLDPKVAKKRYIDLHDMPDPRYYVEKDLKGVQILVKSQYHRQVLEHLPDEKFVIIPNGVETEQFANMLEKTKNNLVYTSSYDRGLEHLLKMWADVKKEVPDATLDIYYGFQLWDARNGTGGASFKQYMQKLFKQPGVTEHGRVATDEVAKAYLKADVFAYPTDFPEIDCISLTKAMAAKCVPITTDYAVMPERNQGIMLKGHISKTKENFKQELIALLKDDKRKQEIRSKLDVSSYDWDEIAKRWSEEFKR